MTGLDNLHEGITICHPKITSGTTPNVFGDWTVVASNTQGNPAILVLDK